MEGVMDSLRDHNTAPEPPAEAGRVRFPSVLGWVVVVAIGFECVGCLWVARWLWGSGVPGMLLGVAGILVVIFTSVWALF